MVCISSSSCSSLRLLRHHSTIFANVNAMLLEELWWHGSQFASCTGLKHKQAHTHTHSQKRETERQSYAFKFSNENKWNVLCVCMLEWDKRHDIIYASHFKYNLIYWTNKLVSNLTKKKKEERKKKRVSQLGFTWVTCTHFSHKHTKKGIIT